MDEFYYSEGDYNYSYPYDDYYESYDYDEKLSITSGTIILIIAIIGLVLNFIVIIMQIINATCRHSVTNSGLLVLNLAIADLISSGGDILLIRTERIHHEWLFSESACRFNRLFRSGTHPFVVAYTIVFMVIDRCIVAKTGSTRLRIWNPITMFVCWVLGIVGYIVIPLHTSVDEIEGVKYCEYHEDPPPVSGVMLSEFIISYLIPFIIQVVLWLLIIKFKASNKSNRLNGDERECSAWIDVTFVIISVAFIYLNGPIMILGVIVQAEAGKDISLFTFQLLLWLYYANVVVRPAVILTVGYKIVWLSKKFGTVHDKDPEKSSKPIQ